MDAWGWQQLQPWLTTRLELPVGPLFCIVTGTTRGRHWANAAARADLRRTAARAGVRRRFAPHQLRHAHAVEMAHKGVPLVVIQRQLGHSNLGITSVYLQGIDSAEIIDTVHARPAPRCKSTPFCAPQHPKSTQRTARPRAEQHSWAGTPGKEAAGYFSHGRTGIRGRQLPAARLGRATPTPRTG
jgi:hypothetical protein